MSGAGCPKASRPPDLRCGSGSRVLRLGAWRSRRRTRGRRTGCAGGRSTRGRRLHLLAVTFPDRLLTAGRERLTIGLQAGGDAAFTRGNAGTERLNVMPARLPDRGRGRRSGRRWGRGRVSPSGCRHAGSEHGSGDAAGGTNNGFHSVLLVRVMRLNFKGHRAGQASNSPEANALLSARAHSKGPCSTSARRRRRPD